MSILIKDRDGSTRVKLWDPTGNFTAEVLLHGGQVVSWKSNMGQELLFMSSKAVKGATKSIRGGIPIYFPQCSNFSKLEQHGFARNRLWSVDSCPSPLPAATSSSTVDLILKTTEEDLKFWPHRFELRLRVTLVGHRLILIPRVLNTDTKAFSFTFALRNYLPVSDISEVRVEGVETIDYYDNLLESERYTFDNLLERERYTEQADAITFDGEIERAYLSTPKKIAVIDHERKRTYELRKECMPDAVLWNPWNKKAKAIQDLGDDEYKRMICVESAVIEKPIVLNPGKVWWSKQELIYVSSSYCSGQLDPQMVARYAGKN